MLSRKRLLQGRVVSTKMLKTVAVRVERTYRHPVFGKYITVSKKYLAHHEGEALHVGDAVEIQESRPLSARKRWIVTQIVERAL